ncbi:MAG: hypothetical protein CVV00_11775 [Firmicutes bacterium HGW-Firmicutes-5]|jgi:hypothetical protein|nr:MAG: hypothetical protein CVV00_11775 [Firmicutes bacterium HGW-Firmicutes-5]
MKTNRDLFEGLTAKQHLNLLAKSTRQLHVLSNYNNILLAYKPLEVQICRGIEALADAAGKEIKTTPFNCDNYPNKLQFKYKGVLFYQLHR